MNDRDALRAVLIGKVSGICRGFSMADDANHAMCQVCDALLEYEGERAKSLDAESGPFAATFAIYAAEARTSAAKIAEAKKRWELSNASELLQSIEYLLGHLIDATHGQQRELVYAASRFILKASETTTISRGKPASAEQAAGLNQ